MTTNGEAVVKTHNGDGNGVRQIQREQPTVTERGTDESVRVDDRRYPEQQRHGDVDEVLQITDKNVDRGNQVGDTDAEYQQDEGRR